MPDPGFSGGPPGARTRRGADGPLRVARTRGTWCSRFRGPVDARKPAAYKVAMAYEEILYSIEHRVATVTLNRPDRLNAYTPVMRDELV